MAGGDAPPEESNPQTRVGGPKQLASAKFKLDRGVTKGTEDTVHNAIKNMKRIGTFNVPQNKVPEVEIFVQAKLREWDKDESGNFCEEEIMCMMEEWRNAQRFHRALGLRVAGGFCGTLVSMGLVIASVVIALLLSRQGGVRVDDDAGYAATSNAGRREVVVTSASTEDSIFDEMIAFDSATDNWIISDDRLRRVQSVTFSTDEATHHLSIAHVVRSDSGSAGETDKLEIVSTAGHRIRFWENITTLEVKWRGDSQWHTIASPETGGARRLSDSEVPIILGPEDFQGPSYFGVSQDKGPQPPRGRRAKGMVFVGAYGGMHVNRASGGNYREDDCYRVNSTHYYCAGSRAALSLAGWLLVPLLLQRAMARHDVV